MPQRPDPVDVGLGLRIFPTNTAGDYRAEAQQEQANQQTLELNRLRLTAEVERRNAEMAQQRQKQEQDAFLTDAVRRHTVDGKPDFDAVVTEAYTKYPDLAMALEKQVTAHKTALVDGRMKDIDEKQKRMGMGKAYLDRIVDPQSFAVYVPQIAEVDPELAQTLGSQFNPEVIGKLRDGYPTEAQRLERAKAYYGTNVRAGILFDLAHAESPEEYQATLQASDALNPRAIATAIRSQFGQDTPETRQRILAMLDQDKKPETAPKVGSSEDYILRTYGPNATPEQVRKGLREHASATRFETPKDGGGDSTPKLTGTAVEKIAAVDQARGMIDDLDRLFPKLQGAIGPFDQWATKAKLASGRGITPELADFDTQLTALKNAVIKATTGAAMSEPEAQRIMGQIPDWGNPEQVFKSRLAMTRKNLELLKKRTLELSGGVAETPKVADPLGIRKGG